jgi:uncharacterized spore protein YtfJ
MDTTLTERVIPAISSDEQSVKLLESLFAAAKPDTVFGEPVTAGEYTIITAREIGLGGGFGFGRGFGPAESPSGTTVAGGGGIGGGGGSSGRPVAVITIGPNGVRVEPIVDVSRIALRALMLVGGIAKLFGARRMLRR